MIDLIIEACLRFCKTEDAKLMKMWKKSIFEKNKPVCVWVVRFNINKHLNVK